MNDQPLNLDEEDGPPGPESFETAAPAKAPEDRNGTHKGTPESEAHFLACCLLDEGHTLDRAAEAGLATTDLTDRRSALIYGTLRRMRAAKIPIGLDTLVPELGRQLPQVGGLPHLLTLTVETTARAAYHIQRILDASARARFIRQTEETLERAKRGEDLPEMAPPKPPAPARTPFSFRIPAATDASILLGNRYLNRGDGLVLSSSSGTGKSSMSHQMAGDWALGLPFHGIKPNGPLRSLIVQSEDSDGDIAEVWQSLAHVRQWTIPQRTLLDANIRIISERSLRGTRFITWLRQQATDFSPDLVWLNPLQAFIDGDVTDSKDLGCFLREGLNGINREGKFGYVIVHHTTKPATGRDRHERLWHEVMYDMAGGAEIINWARGIISLRALDEPGKFRAVLAKRGRRANVTRRMESDDSPLPRLEIVTQFGLQHASGFLPGTNTGLICWEPYELPSDKPAPAHKTGRAVTYNFEDYRSVFPKPEDRGLPLAQLVNHCLANGPANKNSFPGILKRWQQEGCVEIIRPSVGPTLYRAARQPGA